MADLTTIELPTKSGSIELREAAGSSQCTSCGVRGGGLLELHVDRGPADPKACIPVCGSCVADAIAVHLRRRRALPARPGPESNGDAR